MADAGKGETPETFQARAVWIAPEEETIQFANQFAVQFLGETFVVSMGQVAPPMILGTDEERQQQAESISFLPVKTLGRFSMPRSNLEEFIGVLQQVIGQYDKVAGRRDER
jgi:hypothetical protein